MLVTFVHAQNGLPAIIQFMERQFHAAQKHTAVFIKQNLSSAMFKQRNSQLILQPGNALAEVGLGYKKLFRRFGHIARFRYGLKIFQLCQIQFAHSSAAFIDSETLGKEYRFGYNLSLLYLFFSCFQICVFYNIILF